MSRRAPVPCAVLVFLLAALAGCGTGNGYPLEPTVVLAGLQEATLASGGLGHFTATVRSGAPADDVVVDFFLRPAGSSSCAALPLAAASTVPFSLARDLASATPPVPQQRRFFSTRITYTPDGTQREAQVLQSFQVPDLEPGSFEVVAAVRGKVADCLASRQVTVAKPTLPDLTHTSTTLRTTAFHLPPASTRGPSTGPTFAVSSEIANVGRALQGEVEVGFALVIDGTEYPLQVEQNLGGGPVKAGRYRYAPRTRGGAEQAMLQGDVRGAMHRLHLGEAAVERLRSVTVEKTCTLKITLDPDQKIAEASREDDVASLPVRFLPGDAPCSPSDASLTQVQYCFGPDDPRSSGLAPGGRVASQFGMADSATNPSYVAASPPGAQGIPDRIVLNLGSHSGVSRGGSGAPPAGGLLDVDLAFTVQPGVEGQSCTGSSSSPASFSGTLSLLGTTVFTYDRSVPHCLETQADFPGWKKDVKKEIFTDVDVLGFIPVSFTFGIEGEIGVGGSATLFWETGTSHLGWNVGVVPYLGVSAWGEAAVDLVVCEVGVGVELDVVHVQPEFRFVGDVFLESEAGKADATLFLDVGVPIAVKAFDGEFYLFVKVPLIHTWKDAIVAWDGVSWSSDAVAPIRIYVGPVGQFVQEAPGGDSLVRAIYAPTTPGDYAWTGRVSLQQASYAFDYRHVKSILLQGPGGSLTVVSACGSGTATVAIPAAGIYTLSAKTDATCPWTAGDEAQVWWTQVQEAVEGPSGRAPTPDGTPGCAVGEWLFNSDIFQGDPPPAAYQCTSQAGIGEPLYTPPGDGVNAPIDGLWALWRGRLSETLSAVPSVLFRFHGNPPPGQCLGNPYTGDLLELTLLDSTGAVVYSSSARSTGPVPLNPFPWDANGNGQLVVPLSGTGPWTYAVKYHPLDLGDCGTVANAALLSVSIAPIGAWFSQTTCSTGGVPVPLPPVLVGGPDDASKGNIVAEGGVFSENRCTGAPGYDAFVSEYVVGAFDFSGQAAPAQDYEFVVGASVAHAYELFVDGARVASRAGGTASPMDPCSSTACSTREKQLVQTLTNTGAGPIHVVEGFFSNPAGAAGALSENRIRWTPAPVNATLGYLYASAAELQGALHGDGTAGEPGTAPVPLMVVRQSGALPALLSWAGAMDCDGETVAHQLDCANSLLPVGGNGMGFSALWDGKAALQDQVPYFVTIDSDRDVAGFWVDGQSYSSFQVGLTNPVPYAPFPAGSLFVAVLNKQPPTATGLNSVRLATSTTQPASYTSAELSTSFTAGQQGDFLVIFLDASGKPRTLAPATGNHGTGESQAICLGQGCGTGGVAIPSWSTGAYVLAAPVGDPAGTCATPQSSAIDLVVTVTSSQNAGQTLTLCVDGWCSVGNALTGSNTIASPSFYPYAQGDASTGEQALTSQEANSVVGVLQYGPACPQGDCSRIQVQLGLGYRPHAW